MSRLRFNEKTLTALNVPRSVVEHIFRQRDTIISLQDTTGAASTGRLAKAERTIRELQLHITRLERELAERTSR